MRELKNLQITPPTTAPTSNIPPSFIASGAIVFVPVVRH
jgi:hypothetical protein